MVSRAFRVFLVRSCAAMVVFGSLAMLPACNTSPSVSEQPSPAATSSPTTEMAGHAHGAEAKININTAILSELDKLEATLGVPALSHKIQASRPYGSPEDLVSKQVITQAQFDQIKDMVTIEDVVLTGEAKDVDYMLKLGLMQGHMLVAKELLDLNQPAQAEPHIGHPVEEIYLDVEDQIQERGVPDFKDTLMQLQELVKSKPQDAQIAPKFEASTQAINTATEALPAEERQSPEFVLQVISGLLDSANAEYTAAIANGKISAAIEYQDSRGFVLFANQLYKTIESKLATTHPDAQKAISQSMTELLKAWPAVVPPAAPVKTPEQVTQLIDTIEQQVQAANK